LGPDRGLLFLIVVVIGVVVSKASSQDAGQFFLASLIAAETL